MACSGLAIFAFSQFSEKQQLSVQLEQQTDFRSQLLEQVEVNTQQRITYQRQIATLEDNLSNAANQISSLSQSPQKASADANPDLAAIREEFLAETVAEQRTLSMKVTAGEIEATELRGKFGSSYIAEQLASVLTTNEMAQFEDYMEDKPSRTMRRLYNSQLTLMAHGPVFAEDVSAETIVGDGFNYSNSKVSVESIDGSGRIEESVVAYA